MKKLLPPLLFILLSAGCWARPTQQATITCSDPYNKQITVKNIELCTQVVNTPAQMAKGLSGKEKLTEKQGMLFDFGSSFNPVPTFWMKDMKFGIDIIWIKDNKIIAITKNVPAPSERQTADTLPTYSPPSSVDHVLEVNAGWSERHNIDINDKVDIIDQK